MADGKSGSSPEEVFAEARSAVERGDWETLCACLDRNDLLKVAGNGFNSFLSAQGSDEDVLSEFCREHSIPENTIPELRALDQRILESAQEMWSAGATVSPEQAQTRSQEHRKLVTERERLCKGALKSSPDLPRLAAALERAMRAARGGGSVSSRLFVGEQLEEVVVDGSKARATRRTSRGFTDEIGFVKRKSRWYIRLRARIR